jgi:hypothetical protein
MCSRTENCSAIVAASDESFVEHLRATGCAECFDMAERILYRAAKEATNRYLESLKPRDEERVALARCPLLGASADGNDVQEEAQILRYSD